MKTLDVYILKTYRPGMRIIAPELDPAFAKELAAFEKGKLQDLHPSRADLCYTPYNWHVNHMLLDHQGDIKKELIIHEVPKVLEDGTENVEGLIELEIEYDVIHFMNLLAGTKDKRISLAHYGKQLSEEGKTKLIRLAPEEQSDLNNKDRLNRRPNSR